MQLEHYLFIEKLDDNIKHKIKKNKNVNIIYLNELWDKTKLTTLNEIKNYCKKYKRNFFIINNFSIATKFKANGIFITSTNRSVLFSSFLKKGFKIIGSCHNQLEYFKKLQQKCEIVTLSPIFYTKKYSKNKIMGLIRFNLISLGWKIKLCALGGIKNYNIKKILLTKAQSVGYKI
jgi:thiamine monophosphate synthase